MNEREKKLEKKDSWGYIINIIYEITTSNALLNVPENGESGYTGRQYLLSNPLIFFCISKKYSNQCTVELLIFFRDQFGWIS